MRVALISDIHANEVALNAVLQDIRQVGVDLTVCLGDVATLGPRPSAILAMLRDAGCPCIMGNHDEFLLEPTLIEQYTELPVIRAAVDWCRAQLSTDELAFVRTFQRGLEVPLDGETTLRLFHGSPRSHMEDLLATTPPDELDRLLDGTRAPVMAGGHTHLQMLRQHRGMLLVNPGSVGLPFREYASGGPPFVLPHAEYAIVDGDRRGIAVTLKRLPLDKRALKDAAAACDNPLAVELVRQYS
jgi:predicted phosphodiesterase